MRSALDRLYALSGAAAALSLLALLGMVVVQMTARWASFTVTGLTEMAGYCMGATSFFALGYALHRDAHIRVEIVLGAMERDRRPGEILATGLSAVIAAVFAFYAIKANWMSFLLQERSQGQDAVPVWIPQLVMSFGTIVLFVAVADRLVTLVRAGSDVRPEATERPRDLF